MFKEVTNNPDNLVLLIGIARGGGLLQHEKKIMPLEVRGAVVEKMVAWQKHQLSKADGPQGGSAVLARGGAVSTLESLGAASAEVFVPSLGGGAALCHCCGLCFVSACSPTTGRSASHPACLQLPCFFVLAHHPPHPHPEGLGALRGAGLARGWGLGALGAHAGGAHYAIICISYLGDVTVASPAKPGSCPKQELPIVFVLAEPENGLKSFFFVYEIIFW